ncbi:MAG: neutral amino acid transporter [Cirrosporium novae-zelandiae]|nr:MAG: neutral amino acid transporter [Cirrosporium novae-zelandiae]
MNSGSPSRSRPMQASAALNSHERSGSISRAASTARLGSPVPSTRSPINTRQASAAYTVENSQEPLPAGGNSASFGGPGSSALAAALRTTFGQTPPQHGTPARRPPSPSSLAPSRNRSNYGSLSRQSGFQEIRRSSPTVVNPDIVKRHLVQPLSPGHSHSDHDSPPSEFTKGVRPTIGTSSGSAGNNGNNRNDSAADSDEEEFSSLQLQGGDTTRGIYRWAERATAQSRGGRLQRSKSMHEENPEPEEEIMDINYIKAPGGFRRDFVHRSAGSPAPDNRQLNATLDSAEMGYVHEGPQPSTRNFLEFLSLYGHFAGEDLEEEDEGLTPEDSLLQADITSEGEEPTEETALMATPTKRRRKPAGEKRVVGKGSPSNAALLLLKSFVGTGVLFLPRAYLNGGMVFSNVVLLGVSALSYFCFILLVTTSLRVPGSFGHIGLELYGKHMYRLIQASLVLSQIGFVAAYIVFTSENLQAFILAISRCRVYVDVKWLVLGQLLIFLPMSLFRKIHKLSFTAYIADAFIFLGLFYLYYYDIATLVRFGQADIVNFNSRTWTSFIGTAIFTFEGIGLIIPIQESMKEPKKFPKVLAGVMVIITCLFVSLGWLGYAAFGSSTKTVILSNLPQDNKVVNGVQLMYSLAIMLSTPLQLFPAITIMEREIFHTRSGKNSMRVKWKKNVFRFIFVILCALIAWGGAGDLDKFVSIVGSFACIPLVYIYPPMLHYKKVARTTFAKALDVGLGIFGLVGMVYTTTLTMMNWAAGNEVKSPGYCDI